MEKEMGEKLKGARFVYFDVGNVLFSFNQGLESLSSKLNIPLFKVKEFWRDKDDDMCRGVLDPQVFWKQIETVFGYKGADINFIDFWIRHFSKIEKGHELAYSLAKDFQLGLLTNAYPGVIEKVVGMDIMPKVTWSTVIKSCDYGLVKPERELFEIALSKTGFKPGEVVLIDDIKENCVKANECGWRSVQFLK